MTRKTPFKVIIAGGSIAGLTLANLLEKADIDYVVLEAYGDFAPQVGASIGILPYGGRILDQLGVFKKILALAPPVDHMLFHNEKGQVLAEHKGVAETFWARHGYPIAFLDRQMVLQVLYENIKDKSKLLKSKQVTKVEIGSDSVTAIAADGTRHTGDILVGADGIHSQVRHEMWRIADDISPGYIPSSEKQPLSSPYSCIFGISNPVPGIETGSFHVVFNNNWSYLVLGGLNQRCYWFLFYKNFGVFKVKKGDLMPRYTKEEEARLLEEHKGDNILQNLTFGDILKKKIISTLTTLPEHVFQKWSFQRIITLGDSAHKMNPINGHGGNSAIESVGTLVNQLVPALKKSRTGSLGAGEIDRILSSVRELRVEQVSTLVKDAHDQQCLQAMETPLMKLAAHTVVPLFDTDNVLNLFSKFMPNARKVTVFDYEEKPKMIPYHDDLYTMPVSRGIVGWFQILFFVILAAWCYYGMWVQPNTYGVFDSMADIVDAGYFSDFPDLVLQREFTGIQTIDNLLYMLNVIFLPGILRWNKAYTVLQFYFLGMLVAPIIIFAAESHRKRNKLSPVSLIGVLGAIYQCTGIGFIMVLWYALYTVLSNGPGYWWPTSRKVQVQHAKAIIPAVIVGYVIPFLLMMWPWKDQTTSQFTTAFWQPSPVYVQILVTIFGYFVSEDSQGYAVEDATKPPADVGELQKAYVFGGVFSALLHLGTVFTLWSSNNPALGFSAAFLPNAGLTGNPVFAGFQNVWLPDFWSFFIASVIWCCCAIYDLKRVGRAVLDVGKTSTLLILGSVVLGPGTVMAGTWYYRENAMARTQFRR